MSDTNYAVIYDLHSHTTASDGCLTPEALVHRAVEMRVGTLAITDHDTTAAIAPAREEISRSGLALNLIPGVEISTVWENHEIHIVGLNIDITHPLMCEFLAQQTERRNQRAQRSAAQSASVDAGQQPVLRARLPLWGPRATPRRPPAKATFVMKELLVEAFFSAGADQKGCPARVVGTSWAASTPEASLGSTPSASADPAPTIVQPLTRIRSAALTWSGSIPVTR